MTGDEAGRWRVLALAVEAASLALWLGATTQPGRSQTAVVAAGLALSWLAGSSLSSRAAHQQGGGLPTPAPEGKQRFFGWALRLHRCLLPYTFPPVDRITGSSQLPAALRLGWLLLVKSGAANVAVVSLALQQHSLQLLLEQAVLALMLVKRAPTICAAAAPYPQLAGLLQEASAQLQRRLPLVALAALYLTVALLRAEVLPGLTLTVMVILVFVAVVPVGIGWWEGLLPQAAHLPRPVIPLPSASLGEPQSSDGSSLGTPSRRRGRGSSPARRRQRQAGARR